MIASQCKGIFLGIICLTLISSFAKSEKDVTLCLRASAGCTNDKMCNEQCVEILDAEPNASKCRKPTRGGRGSCCCTYPPWYTSIELPKTNPCTDEKACTKKCLATFFERSVGQCLPNEGVGLYCNCLFQPNGSNSTKVASAPGPLLNFNP
ncbi:hypothetical protein RND81_11G014400 [Saponaria officinalis]|uniref:Uncharacterized protein n=1 Tax=Saponaria officinalis TaxID=3572 RepID=A0AAW1HGW2_SAPOF